MFRTRVWFPVVKISLVCELALTSTFGTWHAFAAEEQPPGPDRFTALVVNYLSHEWWLVRWLDNDVACQIFIEHEGMPTDNEIYAACGEDLYDEWAVTQPCSSTTPESCSGYYLLFVKSMQAQRELGVALPAPVIWVTIEGCFPTSSTHLCWTLPTLVLTGDEPLPNETITRIEGRIDGKDFTCTAICYLDLGPTDEHGLEIEFWAYSSYGDSSEIFTAQVRVMSEDEVSPTTEWYADVLSTQWRGAPLAGCAQIWGAFPPVGGSPAWLSTPDMPDLLASDIPYEYLSASLIRQGVVDISGCLDGGLLPNGLASLCGMQIVRPAVDEWQNRFDQLIFDVAQDTGVPARLLKNLFSRESQFWPGIYNDTFEVGLGQMTEGGADTTLLWNPSFYEQFCPLVLDDSICQQGYPHLDAKQQEILRGALVHSVDAFCTDCPLGIDLRQADLSVSVFAETILASCAQTGTIIHNATGQTPGEVSTYEDLWRFTLINYNAGPGCLILAVQEVLSQSRLLDWELISANLTPICQGSIDYVEDINR